MRGCATGDEEESRELTQAFIARLDSATGNVQTSSTYASIPIRLGNPEGIVFPSAVVATADGPIASGIFVGTYDNGTGVVVEEPENLALYLQRFDRHPGGKAEKVGATDAAGVGARLRAPRRHEPAAGRRAGSACGRVDRRSPIRESVTCIQGSSSILH